MNRYDKHKDSGVEWIGEIPYNWKEIKLKYIGYMYSGLSGKNGGDFKQVENHLNKTFIPFTNVANNINIDPNKLEHVVIQKDESQNLVKKNDLFFMMSSENFDDVGKATILLHDLGETYLNSFCKGFRVTSKNVNAEYLNYLLLNDAYRKRMMIEANGFTRINLKMEKVNDFLISLPPLMEQTIIANFLDEKTSQIDKLIFNKQKLIELLKEERTAIINNAVTKGINPNVKLKPSGIEWLSDIPEHWEVKKLKYVAKLRDELIQNADFKIAVENIESGSGNIVNMEEEKIYEGQLSSFKKGDTIFNKLRPYLHKVYLAEKDGGLFGELLIIYTKGELISSFLYYKLFSKEFIDIVDGSTQGTKMPRANWNDFISQLFISFPKDKLVQNQIVEHIDIQTKKVNSTISKIEKEIELMQEYRTALISEVVTGKIKIT